MIGPIINESQLNGLRHRIEEAVSSGARRIIGGRTRPCSASARVFRSDEPDATGADRVVWADCPIHTRPRRKRGARNS
jgi:acyl-CoA reductase-like NAD-dependent aldehyde dehydrogenase